MVCMPAPATLDWTAVGFTPNKLSLHFLQPEQNGAESWQSHWEDVDSVHCFSRAGLFQGLLLKVIKVLFLLRSCTSMSLVT